MSDNKAAFAKMREHITSTAAEVLYKCAADAVTTICAGYEAVDVVRAEDGTVLSKIDPKTIATAVGAKIGGAGVIVFINGDAENDEAHRQEALGAGSDVRRNPFLAALFRLRQPESLRKITGLDVK